MTLPGQSRQLSEVESGEFTADLRTLSPPIIFFSLFPKQPLPIKRESCWRNVYPTRIEFKSKQTQPSPTNTMLSYKMHTTILTLTEFRLFLTLLLQLYNSSQGLKMRPDIPPI